MPEHLSKKQVQLEKIGSAIQVMDSAEPTTWVAFLDAFSVRFV